MRLEPESPRRTDEERRYFPDWTRSLVDAGEEIEADHNSYLAGGYAEEFGYRAQPGSSRGVRLLDGESPEESPEWHSQAGATHPGYPIKPRPVMIDGEQTGTGFDAALAWQRVVASREAPLESARENLHGTFVRVTDRPYEHARHRAEERAAGLVTRLLAGLVSLRWGLPHGRRVTPRD
jgi:hypothetical protein